MKLCRPVPVDRSSRRYIFTQTPLFFDDFTAASMKAMPAIALVEAREVDLRRRRLALALGADGMGDLGVDGGEGFQIALRMPRRNARHAAGRLRTAAPEPRVRIRVGSPKGVK